MMNAPQPGKRYTYADYVTWDDGVRYELIDGIPHVMSFTEEMMAPAPAWVHQGICAELLYQLKKFLKGKTCKVFSAPFDVRLFADKGDGTVVQPDITVVCDRSKLQGTGCAGAPDMVIEILSPSSFRQDRFVKFLKYQEAGVREYWIVDPEDQTVFAHVLHDGKYFTNAYGNTGAVPVHVLDGCTIDLAEVFAE
jgi:Uma2 family endonuclease